LIVIDSSAVIELLLNTAAGRLVETAILRIGGPLHAPHLLDLEVLQVLRSHSAGGVLSPGRAKVALDDFKALRIRRHGHFPLIDRIWRLRHNLTAYDACYVALAERLGAVLLTGDAGIASLRAHRARIELI
jgi:predicted nucleic acid-binding protein